MSMPMKLVRGVFLAVLTFVVPAGGFSQRSGTSEEVRALLVQAARGGAFTPIYAIQGHSHRSPMVREPVDRVPGVVTGIRGEQGFYMQNPLPDEEESTSEGIYVFTGATPQVSVGDLVLVGGLVREYYPGGRDAGGLSITQITRPAVSVVASDRSVPEPVVIGRGGRRIPHRIICNDADGSVEDSRYDPRQDGIDFFESLEGMLVQVDNAAVVAPVHDRYGEIIVVADGGYESTRLTTRGGLVISEGDLNPERIMIDVRGDPAILPPGPISASVGDRFVAPVVGVVDYSWYWHKILPTEPLPRLADVSLKRQVLPVSASSDKLSVGAFNVRNLSPASGSEAFEDIAHTIVHAMKAPDILVLSEVQDGNGPRNDHLVSADRTVALLRMELERTGTRYEYRDVPPEDDEDGGQPGGNIRVGFLFRPDRVGFADLPGGDADTPVRVIQRDGEAGLSASPGRIVPNDAAFRGSRKPLAGQFSFRGRTVFVVGVHLASKRGDAPLFGRLQPPPAHTEAKRVRQAENVAGFVSQLLDQDPDALVVVAGDMNDFEFSATLETLESPGLTNLVREHVATSDRYSYIYQGNSQCLDHILASTALAGSSSGGWILHRYCEYRYAARHGDHDPVVVHLALPE